MEPKNNQASVRLIASAVGASLAETITLPADVAKTRLQVQVKGKGQNQYKGMVHCIRHIYSNEGPCALWKGFAPALTRQVLYSSLSLVMYEPVRNGFAKIFNQLHLRKGKSPSFFERLLAGGTAGALIFIA